MDSPATDSSYYPSAKLTLIVRLDEFEDSAVQATARKSIQKPPIKLKGVKDPKGAKLPIGTDPDAPKGVSRPLVGSKNGMAPTASSDGYTFPISGIIPKTANLNLNGARTADTLEVSFRWADLPIDPRTVRSCAVIYYLGTVTADEYQRGIAGETRPLESSSGNFAEPLNVVESEWLDKYGVTRTNKRFQGWVDKWDVDFSDANEPLVHLTCRDNTCVLIEQDSPPQLSIGSKGNIDDAIATYLSNFPQFSGWSVEYQPHGEDTPSLGKAFTKLANKGKNASAGVAPSKGGGGASAGADTKLSVWDHITDVCRALGLMNRVEGSTIIISPALTYTASKPGTRLDDPFTGRTLCEWRSMACCAALGSRAQMALMMSSQKGSETRALSVR